MAAMPDKLDLKRLFGREAAPKPADAGTREAAAKSTAVAKNTATKPPWRVVAADGSTRVAESWPLALDEESESLAADDTDTLGPVSQGKIAMPVPTTELSGWFTPKKPQPSAAAPASAPQSNPLGELVGDRSPALPRPRPRPIDRPAPRPATNEAIAAPRSRGCDRHLDVHLARLIEAWPHLSVGIRAAIKALVDSSMNASD